MNPVKVGVVGCGVIGPAHMAGAGQSEYVELVAVADLIEERRTAAAGKYGVGKAYASGDELIADPEIEAVVLAFPTGTRTELALRALAKGKHVLLEKPVAMNVGQVEAMIAARGDRVVGVCSPRFRFYQSALIATDYVASGALGELRVVRCRSIVPCGEKPETPRPDWRLTKRLNGGGILVNWGCYDLDYLMGITGWSLKPKTVFAQWWPVPPKFEKHIWPGSDADTHYLTLIRCEGGTVISWERGEFMAAHGEDAWQIQGTDGTIHLQMTGGKGKKIVVDETTEQHGVSTRTLWEGDDDSAAIYGGPLGDLCEAIREGRQPATNLERALVMQQITDGIYASAEAGASVDIG